MSGAYAHHGRLVDRRRVPPPLLLINLQELLCDVVVIAAEEDEKGAADRWQEEEPIFGKDIVPHLAGTVLSPQLELVFEAVPIQRRKVDVRRSVVDGPVLVVRTEAGMDDQGREAEHHRAVPCRMRNEAFTLEERIKDEARIRQLREGHWGGTLDGTCIRRPGLSEVRQIWVVVRTVRLAEGILVADIRGRRVGKVVVEKRNRLLVHNVR